MEVGRRVRIVLHKPGEWNADAAKTVDGAIGTLKSIYKGMHLVVFDPPLHMQWGGSAVSGMNFDREDLQPVDGGAK